ncbi:MAG TPA: hypothetical protein VHP13_04240, partial [Gammaproteobacteria bacterium]|nr:hypothetical protein [Gammaproteobacteria bacterium]
MPQLRPLAIGLLAALLAAGGAHAAKAPAPKPAAAKKAQPKPAAAKPVAAPPAATAAPPPVDPNLISLETVSGMSEAGAPRLALDIMDRDQPDPAKDPAGWMSWERERIYIYQSSHAWKAVVRRMGKLPKDATPDFRAWEAMQAADAWLHMGDGAKALALVQPLIWDEKHPPDEHDLAALRQLVIRCYTSLGRLDDAQAAVIRYRQDYPKDAGAWPLLEARLFLRSGQPQSALDVLQDVPGDEADMLALLASLRSGALSPGDALGQAVKIGSDSKAPAAEQVRAWIIAAEAADRLHNPVARISALQNALGLQDVLIEQDDVFVLSPDMLWDAYISYGEALGNDLQLVVGDDQAWFVAASNQYDTAPIGAAALFSVVAYDAQGRANAAGGMEPEAARQAHMKESSVAHGQFAALVQRLRYGGVVLRHLYLDSERFKDPESVPAEVRYLLVDDVLAMPDIPLASQLLQGLDSAPPAAPGEKRDEAAAEMAWQLKRAHVFILGGDPAAGVASLHKL